MKKLTITLKDDPISNTLGIRTEVTFVCGVVVNTRSPEKLSTDFLKSIHSEELYISKRIPLPHRPRPRRQTFSDRYGYVNAAKSICCVWERVLKDLPEGTGDLEITALWLSGNLPTLAFNYLEDVSKNVPLTQKYEEATLLRKVLNNINYSTITVNLINLASKKVAK